MSGYTASKGKRKGQKRGRSPSASSSIRTLVRKELKTQAETNMKDYFIESAALSTIDQFCVNAIANTTAAPGGRIGSKVSMQSLDLKVGFVPLSTSTGVQMFKWAVVLDRQANGSSPSWSEVCDTSVITDPALAPRNVDYIPRFKILAQDTHIQGHSLQDSPQYFCHKYIDLSKEGETTYSGTTAVNTVISTNALWFFIVPSNQALFSYGVADGDYTMAAHLTYKDF